MRLGTVLVVIRYNAGYSGIRELFDILQIPVSSYLDDLFTPFDNRHMLSHIHADIPRF